MWVVVEDFLPRNPRDSRRGTIGKVNGTGIPATFGDGRQIHHFNGVAPRVAAIAGKCKAPPADRVVNSVKIGIQTNYQQPTQHGLSVT